MFKHYRIPVTLKGPEVQRVSNLSIEEIPFDILNRIFSLLKSHPKALLACSKVHPIFSQIVERYRFRHIIIDTGCGRQATGFTHSFDPSDLRKQLAETPHIVKHVAVLQIEFDYPQHPSSPCPMAVYYEEISSVLLNAYMEQIASFLPMFPVLECIMLPTLSPSLQASLEKNPSQAFRTALEDCLHLPTLQEVHVAARSLPFYMLDNHANVNTLVLFGSPKIGPESLETTYPQIKSLALEGFKHEDSMIFRTWAKRHVVGLQSLKYDLSCDRIFLDVINICSDTLENLHICLRREGTSVDLSSLPHLRHLIIHAAIFSRNGTTNSWLPKAAEILETASLQKLTIDIYVNPLDSKPLEQIDLSPLNIISTKYSVSFPHVDLYMYTGAPHLPITPAIMRSLLAKHKLLELVEQGVLVVHSEEAAPTSSRSYRAKENDHVVLWDVVSNWH